MERPAGIVTFLFTDIEGSTSRWESDAAGMRVALARHDIVLRETVEAHGGWLFKHTGDGVCAAFVSPGAAVHAAVAAQNQLELPVRMGLATGEAESDGDDYFGPTLNLAARVMSAGHGGQILVAESTAALVDADLVELGEFQLRGLSGRRPLFQVSAPGLPTDFPPLVTVDSVPGNLPHQTTSLLGRDGDVSEVCDLLTAHQLVTLTGVGGVGKTRLSLEVAAEMSSEFSDGVWLVELADVGDPRAVPSAVAGPLGIVPRSGRSITDAVADSLADRQALIVLDNCEHVLDAAAELVEATLARSSVVKVLATSRESLRVAGEHVWAVPSLDVRAGTASSAVALFVERAQAVDSSFSLSDEPEAVAEICEQLDGIALAIELAAARMVSMGPVDLKDRLGDRFRLLSGGRRGLERHQTLRHAVQWSYELLDEVERHVLDRCSAFAGGFDAVAAAAVCQTDEFEVLDALDSLVRKSMLVTERHSGLSRYSMLETIRQFAHDQLAQSGEVEQAHDRHKVYYTAGADDAFARWASPDQPAAYRWFGSELANLRAAFRWSVDRGDIDPAATIAGKTAFMGTYYQSFEPFAWCEELLAHPMASDHRLRKWLYLGAAQGAFLGDPLAALEYAEIGIALDAGAYEPVPHELEMTAVGISQLFAGRPEKWLEIALEASESPEDDLALGPASVVWMLATLGRYDEATARADDMLAAAKATRVPFSIGYALSAYGKAFTEADPQRALAAHREAVSVARDSNNKMFEMVFSRELAGLEAIAGDTDTALDTFADIVEAFHQTGDVGNLSPTLGYLAVFLNRIEWHEDAAMIYGAASRHAAALAMVTDLGAVADRLKGLLGSDYDSLVAHGSALTTGQAVACVHQMINRVRENIALHGAGAKEVNPSVQES